MYFSRNQYLMEPTLNNLCQICYEEFQPETTLLIECPNDQCSAYICNDCMREWLTNNNSCPICHTNIRVPENYIQRVPINIDVEIINTDMVDNRVFCRCNCVCNNYYLNVFFDNNSIISIISKILYLFFTLWLLGFTSYWFLFHLIKDDRYNYKSNTDKFTFHLLMFMYGVINVCFIGGVAIIVYYSTKLIKYITSS